MVRGETPRRAVKPSRMKHSRPACQPRRHREGGRMVGRPWTPEEDELLRALPPREAARRTGRSLPAVYVRRHVLGLANAAACWTPAEDGLVRTLPAKEVARRTGRTFK